MFLAIGKALKGASTGIFADPIRLTLESVVSALVVLLAHITQNPRTVDGPTDLGVAKPVLHILYQVIDFRKDSELTSIQHFCADLYLRTDLVVQQYNASKR